MRKYFTKKETKILRALVRSRMGDEFERIQPILEAGKPALAKRVNAFATQLVDIYGKLS